MGAGKVPGHEKYMKSGADGIFLNLSAAGTTNWGFFLKKTLYGVKRLDDYLIQENDQDAVVIRYGEVILNLAEAAVELSTYGVNDYLAVAQVAFDLLRSIHGGLPAKTMDLEVVRHERRIDLMYEGFRYWDLKRWRIGEEKMHNKTLKALYPILHIDETTSPCLRLLYVGESRSTGFGYESEMVRGKRLLLSASFKQKPGYRAE